MLATRPDLDTIAITRTFDGIEAAAHARCGNIGVAVYASDIFHTEICNQAHHQKTSESQRDPIILVLLLVLAAAAQEGYFDLIELSYGYDAPMATQINQVSPVFLHNYEKGKWREGGRTAMPYPQKHPPRALIVQEERALLR